MQYFYYGKPMQMKFSEYNKFLEQFLVVRFEKMRVLIK